MKAMKPDEFGCGERAIEKYEALQRSMQSGCPGCILLHETWAYCIPDELSRSKAWLSFNVDTSKMFFHLFDDGVHGIDIFTLPDAVEITKALGIRYLWIDTFCIIQDDEKDWETQASLMAATYENAYITLAAGASDDDDGGFFAEAHDKHAKPYKFHLNVDGISHEIYMRYAVSHSSTGWPGGDAFPLMTRAWTLQERHLARRYLCFGPNEIFWECQEDVACSCTMAEGPFNPRGPTEDLPKLPECEPFKYQCSRLNDLSSNEIATLWRRLATDYSTRNLTKPTDKLPALAGLANKFQRAIGSSYLAGLWLKSLREDLAWHAYGDQESLGRVRKGPSWTWTAAGDFRIEWSPLKLHSTFQVEATSFHGDIQRFNLDTDVESRYLRISGKLLPVSIRTYTELGDFEQAYPLARNCQVVEWGRRHSQHSQLLLQRNGCLVGPAERDPKDRSKEVGDNRSCDIYGTFFADYRFWETDTELREALQYTYFLLLGIEPDIDPGDPFWIAGMVLKPRPGPWAEPEDWYERVGWLRYCSLKSTKETGLCFGLEFAMRIIKDSRPPSGQSGIYPNSYFALNMHLDLFTRILPSSFILILHLFDGNMTQTRTYDKDFISRPTQASKPKRIIICCDGTWQSSTTIDPKKGCPSNVTRISRVLAKAGLDREGNERQQLVYYDAGVGTGDITKVEANRQGSQGLGLLENVLEAYNFIVSNYNPGDELYFFGFSRGAFTVRSTAGLVQEVGIVKSHLMAHFLEHYGNFIRGEDFSKPFSQTEHWTKFLGHSPAAVACPGKDTVIQVIGVWDTVGALGIPDMGHWVTIDNSRFRKAYQFHDTDLSANVKHAYHALALDEQRGPFSPCLWCVKPDNKTTKLVQCWFPGAHINVGGGSSDNALTDEEKKEKKQPKGDNERLSSVAYAWMLDRVRPHLALDEEALQMQLADIDGVIQSPGDPNMKAWEKQDWLIGKIDDSYTAEYKAMGSAVIRTPMDYYKREEGYTVERVHPSVFFRQQYHENLNKTLKKKVEVYEPLAMQGWKREYESDGLGKDMKPRKGWTWTKYKKGTVTPENKKTMIEKRMWEFEIGNLPDETSVERWLIKKSWNVESYFKAIEEGW
ncbi:uncharacterized protein FIESC28_09611 [Fusarium coffeatum]|uniref:DUF2235 domain-containing protein n=1 Tax=Fusarium coffeatum TaxID=231269 RepID=A0A366R1Z1_9HYPO|nr:uncharacterized protein FIESC28_09611 [Fusarium coffeatum]RBR10225.1 hypothetical protein FIESC28_09611 [Fusarium coffeatum]